MTIKSTKSSPGEDVDGPRPRSLVSVLGEKIILETIFSFVDYMETTVAAFEQDGSIIGKVLCGNSYCSLLKETIESAKASEGARKYLEQRQAVVHAAIASGHQEETGAAGITICVAPVMANGKAVGAILGGVSEVPSDEKIIRDVAETTGADLKKLQEAASQAFHKPDYLYDAARRHLHRLAGTLGKLYENALDKEQAAVQITSRELELGAINKVTAIANISLDPQVLCNRVAEALKETTEAEQVAIFLVEGEKILLRGSTLGPDEETGFKWGQDRLGEGVVGIAAQNGKAEVVFDIAGDDRISAKWKKQAVSSGVNSLIAMPIKVRDEVQGVVAAVAATAGICSPGQLRFIELLSDQLAISLQNNRLYSDVESKSQFLNNLLDGMAEGVYIYGKNGAFEYINRAGTERTGFSQEEMLGKTVLDIVAPEQVEAIKEMMTRRKAGDTDRYEVDIISKDGHRITLSQSVSPLFQNGAIVGAIGVAIDVTEASKLHKDLKQQNRRLELLQSITEKSVSGLTHGKSLETLVHEVAETFSYDLCNIFMQSVDGSKLQIVASHGYPPEYVMELNNSDTFSIEYQKAKKTPLFLAFLEGRQNVMKDAVTDSKENTLTESAVKHGFHAVVATPLEYRGERLGAIVVYTKEVRDFDQDELGLLSSIAAQASTIAGSAEIYNKLVSSEGRYREIYNIAADWMYMLDSEGVITDCNQTMAQSLGIPRDSIIGSYIYDYEVEADRKKAKVAIARFSEKSKAGMIFNAERNFVSTSGKRLIVELHARALTAPEGHGFHWSVIGRDITEKKEAEQRINLLAAAVEKTHECVIISDLNGDIISINDAGATLLGYEAAAMIGMHMGELWSDRNPEGLKERIFGKTLEGGWEGQMWYRRADGSSFPVFTSSAKVDDENGKPVALVGIARDVSAEQELTTEILRRNRELAVLNAVATCAASSFDLDKTLKSSLDSITNSMNYDGGIIFLVNAGSQLLSPAASTFEIPEEMMDYLRSVKVGQGHSGKIAELGSPIFIDDYHSSPYYLPEIPELIPIESLGGVPLIAKDKVLGVLVVSTATPHEFSDSEQTLLSAVGKSLGVVIESTQLFEDVVRGRSQWEATFDAMTNGVSIHDRDFTIVRANRALARMLGTTVDQLVGRKCYEVFHDCGQPIPACPQARAFNDGVSHTLVADEAKFGAILHISVDPILDQDGNIVGAVHDVRDITEQEKLREQLTQSEKIRALGEMAGGVAHDFNNFLTVILGNTQLMLAQMDGDGDREYRESLESVQRAASDAAETVRRIQEFTRVRTTRSFTTVDLNSVVINAIDVARPRWRDEADARGVKIGIETGLSEIPPVNANESELSEVLINLVMNAADALPDGGTITVSTDVEPGGEWVRAAVADNGKGMDEEVSKRIFEPFFSTKGVGGSGLGLSVAYGIVNRHGGDIMVESREGEGTRFIVRLPAATVADLSAASKSADKVAARQGSAPVRPAKILIIDDEPMIRTLLGDMVQKMGHKFEAAKAGERGLADFDAAASSGEPFDLVLTDLGMPGMSGWEVVEAVKQRSPETPVVLITGWGDQLDSAKMRDSGVDAVVAKPFRVEDIRQLLAKELA